MDVPLATQESYHSQLIDKQESDDVDQHDFIGNEMRPADRIPYVSIYYDKKEIQKQGYFIPAFSVTAFIVKAEKDTSRTLRLFSTYVYTIDLKHGPYQWTIKRRYVDFQRLNNYLQIYRATAQILAPFQRSIDESLLPYTETGGLTELAASSFVNAAAATMSKIDTNEPAMVSPENESKQRGEERTAFVPRADTAEAKKAKAISASADDIRKIVISNKTLKKAKRRQVLDHEMPDFPNIPDAMISENKLQERKARLQHYLSEILKVRGYLDHPETARFLEVSRLSFVHDLGSKGKEGIVEKRPDGCECLGEARNCCFAYCFNWSDTWLTIKDSFVARIDHRSEKISDVMLFDRHFDVYTKEEYPGDRGEAIRKGLFITNQYRYMMLKTDTVDEAIDWKRALEDVINNQGSVWFAEHRFASSFPEREAVYAQWLVDGRDFMDHVANHLELAKEEIFMTDWCLNSQIYTKRPMIDDRWRLDLVLKRKADEGSYQTEQYLMSLSPNIKVLRHPNIMVNAVLWWSHHEKVIVIDQKIAFVGGIDLCYGRWDDHKHLLADLGNPQADPTQSDSINAEQNESAARLKQVYREQDSPPRTSETSGQRRAATNEAAPKQESMTVDDVMKIKYDRLKAQPRVPERTRQIPPLKGRLWPGKDYLNFLLKDVKAPEKPFEDVLDRSIIPRMPWHDIGCVVYGSIARDVGRHFIQRWNAAKVQILEPFLQLELAIKNDAFPFLLPKSYDNVGVPEIFRQMSVPCQVQLLRSSSEWSTAHHETEDSIYQAYLKMIDESQHYVYIENQFFVSKTGGKEISNAISEAIYNRIVRAHKNKETYRVYVVMPLLPGYLKESGAMQMELHYTYVTISKGRDSLLRKLEQEVGDPSQYILFCSLRTYGELSGRLVTELVYVHSKLIIVDDRRCLIGSANINDRSLLGYRDSETAVIIDDTQFSASTMNGFSFESGAFAGSLRQRLFREHLGLLTNRDGDRDRETEIDVSDPVSSEFFDLWKEIAKANTEIYEKVFACTPADDVKTLAAWAKKELETIPLSDSNKDEALKHLKNVRGHLVLFSTEFLSESDLLSEKAVIEAWFPTYIFT